MKLKDRSVFWFHLSQNVAECYMNLCEQQCVCAKLTRSEKKTVYQTVTVMLPLCQDQAVHQYLTGICFYCLSHLAPCLCIWAVIGISILFQRHSVFQSDRIFLSFMLLHVFICFQAM